MRTVFLFMVTSLDGYFEGPNHDITWHMVDDEFNEFAVEQMRHVDTYLFGHRTYDLMYGYWPAAQSDPEMSAEDHQIAKMMNDSEKIVASHTLKSADWANTRVINTNVAVEVIKLKSAPGKDIAIFGSNNLAANLINANPKLIDELRIMVNPIALGEGNSLLTGLNHLLKLNLTKTRQFKNGNELLVYKTST